MVTDDPEIVDFIGLWLLYKKTKKGIEALWHLEQLNELIPGYFPSPPIASSNDLSSRNDSMNCDPDAMRRSKQVGEV